VCVCKERTGAAVALDDRESLEARKANPKNFGAHLRAVGWVFVIFVVVFTAFNLIEYRRHVKATSPSAATARSGGQQQPPPPATRGRRDPALRSLEWEVLIVGVGLGVWLFAARRHKVRVEQLKQRP
jgi:hypothetical protein